MNFQEVSLMRMRRYILPALLSTVAILTCFGAQAADSSFQAKLDAFCDYDLNKDSIAEIETLRPMACDNGAAALKPNDRLAVVLVEQRLLDPVPGTDTNDLLAALARFKEDLQADGYKSRFVAARVYAGERHQDGLTLLAIREFFKSIRANYANFEGAILAGAFPEAMLVQRWVWRIEAGSDGIKMSNNDYFPAGTSVLNVVPGIVAHRADIVLGDLDGNWADLYVQEPTGITGIQATAAKAMDNGWPRENMFFECDRFNFTTDQFEDFFYIHDDNMEIVKKEPLTLRLSGSQRHPEITAADRKMPNPIARPEIIISRINPLHIAVNPDPGFTDGNGRKFLSADGKPQEITSAEPLNMKLFDFWRRNPALERRILLDYFQRNHDYRAGKFKKLPYRASAVGYALPAGNLADFLTKASPNFAKPVVKEEASLLDYVNWLKEPAVLRGIYAHSDSMASWFGGNYRAEDLEAAAGGKPWRWERVGSALQYKPSFAGQGETADLYLHRTIWENKVLKDCGGCLYLHAGCEVNSPLEAASQPYNSVIYGAFQNAEGVLFYLNGVALLARAKGFYDYPAVICEAIRESSQTPPFGNAWKAYFASEAETADLANRPADNKRSYFWSVLGDWTVHLGR